MNFTRQQVESILRNAEAANVLSKTNSLECLLDDASRSEFELETLLQVSGLSEFQIRQAAEGRLLKAGPYILLDCIGRGGMGVVFRAEHEVMRREVAVKILQFAATDSTQLEGQESQAHRRFQREIESLAALRHPNIVRAYDAGRDGRVTYLAMELLNGTNLARRVREGGPLDWKAACQITATLLSALNAAHDQGFVHRDVKPSNVMQTPDGLKLLDLGLASSVLSGGDVTLTETGSVLGTPDYLAPEQAKDSTTAGPAADQYGSGATLYFLLTGEPPFPGRTPTEKLLKHQTEPARPPSRLEPALPGQVDDVVLKLLSKHPDDRFATAGEAASAVAGCLANDDSQPTSTGTKQSKYAWLAASLLVALVIGGIWFAVTGPSPATQNETASDTSTTKVLSELPGSPSANGSPISLAKNAHLVDAVFLHGGDLLAIAWMDLNDATFPGSIVLWDTVEHRVVKETQTIAPIAALAVSPNASTLLAASGHLNFASGNRVYAFNVEGRSLTGPSEIIQSHEGGMQDVLWVSDNEFLSFRSQQNGATPLILKHRLGSKEPAESFYPTERSCSVARFSGQYLVVGEYPGQITVLDRDSMEPLFSSPTEHPCVFDIDAFGENSLLITTGTQGGSSGAIYSLVWGEDATESPNFEFKKLRQLDATPTDIFVADGFIRWCTGNGGSGQNRGPLQGQT